MTKQQQVALRDEKIAHNAKQAEVAKDQKQDDPFKDDFFMPVANTKPYFKCAFEGFAGSGKTYTAALVAIGLHKKIGSKKPVVMFDTEKAAKFLKKIFADAGIELLVRESRTLADLQETMRKLRNDGVSDVLMIDSISHVWENTVEAYKKKKNRSSLQFQDWGVLKPMWKEGFADPLVGDPYHIIMCGRAGYEYENEINPDTNKREIYKSGVKMKVEGETAYEPDMLVLMERFEETLGKDKKVWREATIIKDRSTLIDGKTFTNPTFEHFEPAVDEMLDSPDKWSGSPETDSTGLFHTEEEKYEYIKQKDIALDEIQGWLLKVWPSTGASDKQKKVEAIETVFKTVSWEKVKSLGLQTLLDGLEEIKKIVTAEIEKQFPDKIPEKKKSTDKAGQKK